MSGLYLKNKFAKELVMRLKQSTVGKTYYVDGTYGNDSGSGLYPFDAKKTVQGGVDAVTTNRGDVVVVGAGRYYENVRITKSKMTLMGAQTGGKQSVSIRAAGAGLAGADHAEATPLYGYTTLEGLTIRGSCVTVNAASVEICGLELDTSGYQYETSQYYVYSGIYVGEGTRISSGYNYDCNGSYIHDCIFKRGATGILYDGAAEDHRLVDNLFYRTEGGATKGGVFICPGSNRQSQRILIADNTFMEMEDLCYGILGYSHPEVKAVMVLRNAFLSKQGKDMTDAICYLGTGEWLVAGNWFGCSSAASMEGNSWTAGNYEGSAGNDPMTLFLTEA